MTARRNDLTIDELYGLAVVQIHVAAHVSLMEEGLLVRVERFDE